MSEEPTFIPFPQSEGLDGPEPAVFVEGWEALFDKKSAEQSSVDKMVKVVTGIFVKANQPHQHDGRLYQKGEAFALPCELASELIGKGVVTFIYKIEELHHA